MYIYIYAVYIYVYVYIYIYIYTRQGHLCLWWPSGVPGKQAPQGEIVTPALLGERFPDLVLFSSLRCVLFCSVLSVLTVTLQSSRNGAQAAVPAHALPDSAVLESLRIGSCSHSARTPRLCSPRVLAPRLPFALIT